MEDHQEPKIFPLVPNYIYNANLQSQYQNLQAMLEKVCAYTCVCVCVLV